MRVNTALQLTSAPEKTPVNFPQKRLADVKAATSEPNAKRELCYKTCLKMSSVTSAPLSSFDKALVCWPENALARHLERTAPPAPGSATLPPLCEQRTASRVNQPRSGHLAHLLMSLNMALKIGSTSKLAPGLCECMG